jgi:hypothetical protein
LKGRQCFGGRYYYLGKVLLVFAAIVTLMMAWPWFCRRFPRTAWFAFGSGRGFNRRW